MKRYTRAGVAVIKKRETETWIYSYADLITNLLALFVMLLIVTTGSKTTREKLKDGLERYVKGLPAETGYAGSGAKAIDDLRQMITDYINKVGLVGRVSLERTETGIELTFESALLFESGTALIGEDAQVVLQHVAELLATLPKRFVFDVEGHADRRPIASDRYPSNWELSSARAGAVVRFLEGHGVAGRRMRAIGFAATRPLDDDGAGEQNRRVVIRVNAEEGGE
jgi:chemotaxis protein MotB